MYTMLSSSELFNYNSFSVFWNILDENDKAKFNIWNEFDRNLQKINKLEHKSLADHQQNIHAIDLKIGLIV